MIIHQPEILQEKNTTVFWARIIMDKEVEGFPGYLWYRVPNNYAKYLSTQSDAFLIAALAPAMYFGETIQVQGTVSPRLAYHLEEHMFLTRALFQGTFQAVDVKFGQLATLQANPVAIGAAFSGGVDSFFTLKQHSPLVQRSSEYQISHALFINGFDIIRRDKYKFQLLFNEYRGMLREFSIELIPIETNQTSLIIPWLTYNRFYSPVLIGCAMALGGLFRRFITSNSWDYYQLKRISTNSNPLSDRLLSTETLDIEHFGANYRRSDKVEAIHKWEPVQKHLRVCGVPLREDGALNCSRCEKCMRTMIPIYALGSMDEFNVFAKPLKSNWDLLRWARKFSPETSFVSETFVIAKKYKPQMMPWLWIAALLGYSRYWAIRLIPGFIKKRLNQFGFFLDYLKEENSFDDPDLIKRLVLIDNRILDRKDQLAP